MSETVAGFQALNPVLYGGLCRLLGSNARRNTWKVCIKKGSDGRKYASRKVMARGEEYRVRCPFCKDTQQRLYINHRFGVWDEKTQTHNLWLANCYRRNCLSDEYTAKRLYSSIYGLAGGRHVKLKEGKAPEAVGVREIAWPGPVVRMDRLAIKIPEHPAVAYLQQRDFDPVILGEEWGVHFCPKSDKYRLAEQRIIIPVHFDGQMVGWQARFVGDDLGDLSLKQAGICKYWTSPGLPVSQTGYNFDSAILHPILVVVEGVTDVWKTGPASLAVLGNKMSPILRKKLVTEFCARHPGGIIAVMLDPTVPEVQKNKPHHIEILTNQLRNTGAPLTVVPVFLPEGEDPGTMDYGSIWRILHRHIPQIDMASI